MPTDTPFLEFHDLARELAQLGGTTARGLIGRVDVVQKSDNTPVTEADHRVQAVILDVLARRYPSHSVVTEERVVSPDRHSTIESSEFCWVIDPIDGTRNFARGIDLYSTSVALLQNGTPVTGAIFDASKGRMYSAIRNAGVWCDGESIQVADRPPSADAVLYLSSFRQRQKMYPAVSEWMKLYLFRNFGSLCLHLAWVAAGRADAAFSPECKLWDLAAGALMIEEAGGIVSRVDGSPIWPLDLERYKGDDIPILVGTPSMHRALLSTLGMFS